MQEVGLLGGRPVWGWAGLLMFSPSPFPESIIKPDEEGWLLGAWAHIAEEEGGTTLHRKGATKRLSQLEG